MKPAIKSIFAVFAATLFLNLTIGCGKTQKTEVTETESVEQVMVPKFAAAPENVKGQLKDLYTNYLAVKNALVDAKAAEAVDYAKKLKASEAAIDTTNFTYEQNKFFQEQINIIDNRLAKMDTADVEKLRSQLEPISVSTFALMKAFGANDAEAYLQFCPMAKNDSGAFWLSENKEIRNPYFGNKMLSCGETKEILPKPAN